MALFNAAALLEDAPEEKTIICDFFKMPDGLDYPTIILEVTDKLRSVYQTALQKYAGKPEGRPTKGDAKVVWTFTNNPTQFCHEILNNGYVSSEGLIDEPSKKAILALIKREFGFAKKLSAKLIDLFEHDDLYQDVEEEEKN